MAYFDRNTAQEPAPFKERRVKGKVVRFSADATAEHVPSPAHALQQMLVERTADGFITDPAARHRALVKFVGTAVLLWGGMAAALVSMMVLTR